MAKITIYDLRPVGCEFFADDENYLRELSEADLELSVINGGATPSLVFIATIIISAISATLT